MNKLLIFLSATVLLAGCDKPSKEVILACGLTNLPEYQVNIVRHKKYAEVEIIRVNQTTFPDDMPAEEAKIYTASYLATTLPNQNDRIAMKLPRTSTDGMYEYADENLSLSFDNKSEEEHIELSSKLLNPTDEAQNVTKIGMKCVSNIPTPPLPEAK